MTTFDNIFFTVTDQHLALMKEMNVGWDEGEFGAPNIDPKRPYGNSDVLHDICEILGIDDGYSEDDEDMDEDLRETLTKLHKETQTALQIALKVGYFKAGKYVSRKYH